MSLKVAAPDSGLLAGRRRATLVGVGASLVRWREALGARVAGLHEVGRGGTELAPQLESPVVLALMAPEARGRWRRCLARAGRRELLDFIFVA